MSDPDVQAPSPEVISEARGMGWKPLEEFRGSPEKWVDAETYVTKGKEYLPFIRAENRRLHSEVDGLRGQLTESQAAIKAAQESLDGMKEFYTTETARRVDEARKDVVAQIKAAREADDVDAETELLGQLSEIDAAKRAAKEKPAAAAPPPPPKPAAVDPDFLAWQGENSWYGKDRKKTMLALGIAEEVTTDPTMKGLKGRPFYDEVNRRLEEFLGTGASHTKVETDVAPGGGRGGTKTYADLPADAKAACEKLADKVVGKGRAHPDIASWRKAYAQKYFEE